LVDEVGLRETTVVERKIVGLRIDEALAATLGAGEGIARAVEQVGVDGNGFVISEGSRKQAGLVGVTLCEAHGAASGVAIHHHVLEGERVSNRSEEIVVLVIGEGCPQDGWEPDKQSASDEEEQRQQRLFRDRIRRISGVILKPPLATVLYSLGEDTRRDLRSQ
jgi:hypothetical protein